MSVKLPWELTTMYSEVLQNAMANNPNASANGNRSDDEDEDEMEAHEDSLRRLKVLQLLFFTKAGPHTPHRKLMRPPDT